MAAPPDVTLQDLSGKWVMNKSLSDDFDPVLALQGVGWLTRKAISYATITLSAKQYKDASGATHIDISSTLTGGIKGTTELRTFDGQWRGHTDHIFGEVKGWSRFKRLAEVSTGEAGDDEFLRKGWGRECEEGEVAESHVESVGNGWVATQVWGFEDGVVVAGEGQRRHVRHVVVRKREEVRRVRLVYDWLGRE